MRYLLTLLLCLTAYGATPTPSLVGGVRVSTDTTGTNTIAASVVITNLNGGALRTAVAARDVQVTNSLKLLNLSANTPAVIGPDKTLTNGSGGFSASFDTVADMVASVITPVTQTAMVNRRSTLVSDGVGGGQFYYSSASGAATNLGTVFPTSDGGTSRWIRQLDSPTLQASWFGAQLNGIADDSAAITAARDLLYPLGGVVSIPGKSLFNITFQTNYNITLTGAGSTKDFNSGPPIAYWGPFDPTQPVVRFGDDTGFVRGCGIQNATLYGNSATGAGIYFGGGAFECNLINVTVYSFKTNFLSMGGATYPSSLNFITHFNMQPSTASNARGIYMYMPANQTSYTTALYFGYGHIDGPSGSGAQAVEVDGTALSLSHVYIDAAGSGKGLKLSKTEAGVIEPYIDATDLVVDSDNSTDVLVNVYTTDPKLETWVKGTAAVDGLLETSDAVTHTIIAGTSRIPYQSELSWPQIAGQLSLTDGATGWQGEKLIYNDGSLTLDATTGNLKALSANSITLQPTNGGVILKGGVSGVLVQSANMFFDNGRGIWFKDPLNVDVNVLSSSGYAAQLNASGNILVTPGTNLVVTPGAGILFNAGTAASFVVANQDVYLDNNKAILWKDLGGSYRQILAMADTNYQVLNTAAGKLVIGAMDATYGLVDLYSGGTIKWQLDLSGGLMPQGKYDIGTLLNPAGKGYFTNLNIPKVSAILGTDSAGNLTNISAASIVGVTTNYLGLMLGNPNSAVVTGSTNFYVYPEAATLKTVTFHLLITSSSGSVTADLKNNGTSVLSAPVSIASGSTNATATINTSAIAANDRLVGEITAAGTTAYGAFLRLGTTTP